MARIRCRPWSEHGLRLRLFRRRQSRLRRIRGTAVATALVTGAGRGIGRACALALAREGADVTLISRTQHELDEAANEIRTLGRRAYPIVCDVTNANALMRAVAAVPRLDIVVHAAGGNIPEPFLDVTEEHLDRLLTLNVKAAFLVAQAAVSRMDAGGVIVFIGSQMGHVGASGRTVYCATKHAVEGLTKALAVELAPRRIRVVGVAPTFVETSMTASYLSGAFRNEALGKIPLGRFGDVADVSAAVAFLSSPQASMITGCSLLVDGGWTAQ